MNRIIVFAIAVLAVLAVSAVLFLERGKPTKVTHNTTVSQKEKAPAVRPRRVAGPAEGQRFDWRQVESTSYPIYIKNLRSIGCPEQTIRDIIIADVNAMFDAKEKTAMALTNRVQYWRTGMDVQDVADVVKAQLLAQHDALESERKALLTELLGEGVAVESRPARIDDSAVMLNVLDFVPPEERPKVAAAVKEAESPYETKFKPLLAAGNWSDASRAEYRAFCGQREEKLLAALGPERKENYEMRASFLSKYLRSAYQGLDLSEDEFRELFRFAKQFEVTMDIFAYDVSNEAELAASQSAGRAVRNKAREIVGNYRFEAIAPDPRLTRWGMGK